MYSHPQQSKADLTQELRREAGRWLREKREAAGLSQRQLSTAVGFEYYTFISQIESGRGRIPPDRYIGYARALGVDVKIFTRTLMRYYDPVTFDILFGDETAPAQAEDTKALSDRLAKLEAVIAGFAREGK